MLTRINLFLILMMFSSGAYAQSPASPLPSPKPVEVKNWSLDWNSRYRSSLHESTDASRQASLISTLSGVYSFNPKFRVQGTIGAIQAVNPALDFRVINPEFRGLLQLGTGKGTLKYYLGPTLVLPFGSDAKEESLIFGAGAGGRVSLNLKNEKGAGFFGYYDLTFNKNFHQFETSVFSGVNNEFALNHLIYLDYGFDSTWSVNASFGFSSLWSYFGILSNNYSIDQEIDYQLNSMIMLYLSHSRGGDFLSPNGQNYSFGIFDADSSRITVGVVFSL